MMSILGIDVNLISAALLMLLSVAVLAVIVLIVFFQKRGKDVPAEEQKKDASGCELNAIMGYDLIQVKTLKRQTRVQESVPKGSFSDSKGIGMKESRLGVTGAQPVGYDDEPTPTPEQQKRDREQQKKNEEFERRAREEHMTELTPEQMAALGNADWPEDEEYISRAEFWESQMNNIPIEDLDADMAQDEGEDDGMNDLAGEPAEKEPHDENIAALNSFADRIGEELHFQDNLSEEDDAVLQEINNVGKGDIPDID